MSRVLPILFNTEMVRAILDGKKTVTRRVIRQEKYLGVLSSPARKVHPEIPDKRFIERLVIPPYEEGDVLYVRETWAHIPCIDCCADESGTCGERPVTYEDRHSVSEGCFIYRVDYPEQDRKRVCWSPSIHMPKEAARIWLKVTDVRVERLQEIDDEGAKAEGSNWKNGKNVGFEEKMRRSAIERFSEIWDSTVKKADTECYGWEANPWVWVIEFERCEKPEPCIIKGIEPASDKRPCIGYQKSKEDDEPCEMCKGCKWCDGEDQNRRMC